MTMPMEGFQMSHLLVLAFIAILAFGTLPQPTALVRRVRR
jgi:Sec-independent protein translocase protein TatA